MDKDNVLDENWVKVARMLYFKSCLVFRQSRATAITTNIM